MKSKKPRYAAKILALVLSLLMLLGAMPVAFAATPVAPVVNEWPIIEGEAKLIVGQKYSTLKLVGGSAEVAGHFDWSNPDGSPLVVKDRASVSVYFYPDDTVNYKKVRKSYYIDILKSDAAKVTGSLSVNVPLNVGQKLSEAEIIKSDDFTMTSYDTTYNTTIAWENPEKVMDKVGTYSEKVIITATKSTGAPISEDVINHVEVFVDVTVAGEEETAVITEWPAASEIYAGQSLADSTLTGGVVTKGGNPVSGSFAWKDSSVVPELGTTEQTVIFTPDDISVCEPVETQVSVTAKNPIEIKELPKASDINYSGSQRLSDSVLTGGVVTKGGEPVPGSFVWKNPETKPSIGTHNYDVVFTPDDSTVCEPIEFKVSVTTNKIEMEITWPTLRGHYKVGGVVRNCVTFEGGSSTVPGKFDFDGAHYLDKIPEKMGESMEVYLRFIPNNTGLYETQYKSFMVTFEPADPDCRAEHFISSDGKSFEIRGRIANDENWSMHTGNFYLYLDGEKIELTEPDQKFKYDISTLSAGEHTIYSEYIPGENDVYAHDTSDTVTFNVNAFYAVNVTDSTGTKTLDSYLPGKTVTVTAEPHTKSYYDFTGWTAEGITLTEEEAAQQTISFTMPENEVNLTANYKFNFCNFVKAVFEKIGQVLLGIITEGIAWLKDAIQNIPRP